jgi:hypothetical protein
MKKLLLLLLIATSKILIAQSEHPKFKACLKDSPEVNTTFCLHDDIGLVDFLREENIRIKYRTENWLFVTATPRWMNENQKNGKVKQFYFETSPPQMLNDTTRATRFVNEVHAGAGGLGQAYTGDNILLGFVDTGVEVNHPDLQDANGKTRVLAIWDQNASYSGSFPNSYGYGRMWDSTAINNGSCVQVGTTSHGSNVVGIASGNGLANGRNKGMAPDSKIIMVGTNLNAANWTLTVADACDFIFGYADSLGIPAVVNISAGSYFGSHDGNDPAAVAMEAMLDEKPGRIIVAAAGNSGAQGKYHVTGNVTEDTTFVWFSNNGSNYVYFDSWADTSNAHFDFAFEMNEPTNFTNRGETGFRPALGNLGVVMFDTIWNGSNRIATMQIWTELIDSAYHLEFYMERMDSTTYKCKFKTKGQGKYDLWSGAWLGGNDMMTSLPSPSLVPEVVNYQMPDTLQSIVSSFTCSEKVITVGNFRNRDTYIDFNGNESPAPASPSRVLSPNSSKGPSRINHQKPDISANGDGTLTVTKLSVLSNPANNPNIDEGGWHAKNGGTSMAAPVVAGIAALYLEKCPTASYLDFKRDLIATATSDAITGAVPNLGYGYGRPHALNLLLGPNNVSILGDPIICASPVELSTNSSSVTDSIVWNTGLNSQILTASSGGTYSAQVYYGGGCVAHSDTMTVIEGVILANPIISSASNVVSSDSQINYQWTLNGVDIPGETNQVHSALPPYGVYAVYVTSTDGCISVSNSIDLAASISELSVAKGSISPNPTTNEFQVKMTDPLIGLSAFDVNGKQVRLLDKGNQTYSILHLEPGTYYLTIETEKGLFHSKIVKM